MKSGLSIKVAAAMLAIMVAGCATDDSINNYFRLFFIFK